MKHRHGHGFRVHKTMIVFDVDTSADPNSKKRHGVESYNNKLRYWLDDGLGRATPPWSPGGEPPRNAQVITPSGGLHICYRCDSDLTPSAALKDELPGVDILTDGMACMLPTIAVGSKPYNLCVPADEYFNLPTLPESFSKRLQAARGRNATLEDIDIDLPSAHEGDVSGWLEVLDPSMPNNDWVRVGMGLHEWSADRGLSLWEEWSLGGSNYKAGETATRWRSFNDTPGGVTHISLGYMAGMAMSVKMDAAESVEDLTELRGKAANLQLQGVGFDAVVSSCKQATKRLTGEKETVAAIREELSNLTIATGQDWYKEYVYVNVYDGFLNTRTGLVKTYSSFNAAHMPKTKDLKKMPSKIVLENNLIPIADLPAYMPSEGSIVTDPRDGCVYANIFNPSSVPHAAASIGSDGLRAIELVQKHIRNIFSTEANADIFTQWLAWQVQRPGQLVRWAPLIHSIEGTGKSFFKKLLIGVLGYKNVGVVSSSVVNGNFSGWATGKLVNVLEEVKISGKNRHVIYNALKPMISDDVISIEKKNVDAFDTPNHTNYIGFTNHADALPLNDTSRRWWPVSVGVGSIEEFEARIGAKEDAYFPRLFDCAASHPGELRRWLLDFELSDAFLKMKRAPKSDFKEMMVATEDAQHEGLEEARELLAEDTIHHNCDYICSGPFFEKLGLKLVNVPADRSKGSFLKSLGFLRSKTKQHTIEGKHECVWIHHSTTEEGVKKLIRAYEIYK